MAVSANRLELLQIVDAVAREKSIDRSIVLASMEDAMQKAARSRYGQETEVRAEINPKTGEIRFSRLLLVVEEVENDATQMTLTEAQKKNPSAQIGDWIAESLPPFDYGRIPAQASKQVLVQKIREAERDKQYDVYKDRIGDIINGAVKRVEYGNVVVDLGGSGAGEAVVRRDELIPREMFRPGDRIRAYVYDVRREARGPQIFLSRTHPQFTSKLFAQEVPEIYDGIVEVKSVARDPGSRAKIAVMSNDSSIDPVGACVGMRGSRVQAVVNELQGEKIDIIPWSPDAATFIVNALQPAEVMKVVLDEDSTRIEVVVPDDQLSLAIGRRGQNVRLASQLTGWDIDILTEAEESERRQKEFAERTQTFMDALDVDETVAQLLASEGFRTVEEIAYVEPRELASIEGFDADTAAEIQARAQGHLARIEAEFDDQRKALGVSDDLKEIEGLTTPMLVKLGENGVKTLEDLADCASDDLVGWTERSESGETAKPGFLSGFDISRAQADAMILDARVRAGWIEAPAPQASPKQRKAKAPEQRRDCSIADRELERRNGVGADLHRDGEQRRSRGDAAFRPWPRWVGCSRYPPQAARPRGMDAVELRDGETGGREAGVLARVSRQGGSACFARRGGRRPAGARRATVAVDRQQSRPRRRRRVQGRCGDRVRRRHGAHSGERRRAGRGGQASPSADRQTRPGGKSRRARRSVLVASIGFGIGEGKCDTCCSQTRCSEFGLPREGGSFAPLSRERSGRDNQDRARRRAGR